MAGRGPAPNEGGRSRDRDNKSLEELVYDGQVWGDPLPEGVLGQHETGELAGQDIDWHPQTLVWWDAIRRWPVMEQELEASWQFMVTTAMLHHKMWTNGRWDFAAEVRLREAKYGITPDDLRRLGKKIKRPGNPDLTIVDPGAPVAQISDAQARRERLTGKKTDETEGEDGDS